MLTKKNIQNSGFLNVEELSDNIFYIKNFLSNDDVNLFIKKIEELPETKWSILNDHHHESFHNKFYDHNDNEINKAIRNKINKVPFQKKADAPEKDKPKAWIRNSDFTLPKQG